MLQEKYFKNKCFFKRSGGRTKKSINSTNVNKRDLREVF